MKNLPWQPPAIAFLKKVKKGLLALDMGMGKSRCSIMAAELDAEPSPRVLIICPAVALLNWRREISMWSDSVNDVQIIKTGKDAVLGRIIIVSYDLFTRMGTESFRKPDVVIFDEWHYCKNPKAKRTKLCVSLLKSVDRAYMLTGTPILNRPVELFPMLKALGVVKNYRNFVFEYCDGWFTPWNTLDARGASNIDELKEMLKPIMFRRTKKDMGKWTPGQLPPRVIELDLPVDLREKKFDKDDIAKNPASITIETISDIARESGVRKIPLARNYIADVLETRDKVVVFANHRQVVEELAEGLEKYGAITIHGGTSDKAEEAERFQTDPYIKVVVANTKAAGVAISFTASAHVIFVECPWAPAIMDQAIARCDRLGQTEVVQVDILTIHRSIDAHVIHALLDKREIINEVIQETDIMTKEGIDINIAQMIEWRAETLKMKTWDYLDALFDGDEENELEAELLADDEEEEEEFTFQDVREALARVMRAESSTAVRAILDKFGAKKVSELDEEKYGEVVKLARERIAA